MFYLLLLKINIPVSCLWYHISFYGIVLNSCIGYHDIYGRYRIEVIMFVSWQPGRGRSDSRKGPWGFVQAQKKEFGSWMTLAILYIMTMYICYDRSCSFKSFEASSINVDVVWWQQQSCLPPLSPFSPLMSLQVCVRDLSITSSALATTNTLSTRRPPWKHWRPVQGEPSVSWDQLLK